MSDLPRTQCLVRAVEGIDVLLVRGDDVLVRVGGGVGQFQQQSLVAAE